MRALIRSRSTELLVTVWLIAVAVLSMTARPDPLSRVVLDLPEADRAQRAVLFRALTLARTTPTETRVILLLPDSYEQLDLDIPGDFHTRMWPRKTAVFFGGLPQTPAEFRDNVEPKERIPTFLVMPEEIADQTDREHLDPWGDDDDVVCYQLDWGDLTPGATGTEEPDHDASGLARVLNSPWWSLIQVLVIGSAAALMLRCGVHGFGLRGVALAWVLGTLVVALVVMAAGSLENLALARWVIGLLTLAALVPLWRTARGPWPEGLTDPVMGVAIAAVALWLGAQWVGWMDEPFQGDEQIIWTSKAVAITESGGFNEDYRNHLGRSIHHPDYPPLGPLLQVWMHIGHDDAIGGWLRLPIQLFELAALLYLAGAIARRTREPAAAMIVAGAFLATCIGPQRALCDPMVRFGLLVALDGALEWWRGDRRFARVAMPLGLALMVSSKHEGLALTVVLLLAMVITRLAGRMAAPAPTGKPVVTPAFLVGAAVAAAVWGWNASLGLHNDLFRPGDGGGLFSQLVAVGGDRAPDLLRWFGTDYLLAPRASSFLVLLGLASTLLVWRELRDPRVLLPGLVTLGGCALYVLVFLGSPHDIDWHWGTAGPRVIGHVNFAAALWAASALGLRRAGGHAADARAPDPSGNTPR